MKLTHALSLLFCGLFFLAAGPLVAQDKFDVTQYTADPNTKLFSDGKHTVSGYIVSQLEAATNCCGMDDIYVEIKTDADGNVTSSRVLNSSNVCNKQSVPEIIKHIKWTITGPVRPIYMGFKSAVDCKGTPNDNQYQPVVGPVATGKPIAATQPETVKENPPVMAEEKPAVTPQAPTAQTAAQPQPQATPTEKDTELMTPVDASETPAAQQPMISEATGQPDSFCTAPIELPEPKYERKDFKPNDDHKDSHLNTSGPTANIAFGLSTTKTALYVKKELRKLGICGLAHVLAELTMDEKGNLKCVRFLKYNNEKVKEAALQVLSGMKFQATQGYTTYPIFEFKTNIDCTPERNANLSVDNVPEYFVGPGETAPASPSMNGGTGEMDGNGAIEVPTDE